MAPQRPGDHFYHVKTPNGAVSTRFSTFLMFSGDFLYQHNTSLCQTDSPSLCGTQTMSLWYTDNPSVAQRQSLCPTETVSLWDRHSVSLWNTHRAGVRAVGGGRAEGGSRTTPTPLVSSPLPLPHTHPPTQNCYPALRGDEALGGAYSLLRGRLFPSLRGAYSPP